MIVTMHGFSTMHSNLRTDIRIAGETGHDGLEIVESKLLRYLDNDCTAKDLVPVFKAYSIQLACINALKDNERTCPKERAALMAEAERLCAAGRGLALPDDPAGALLRPGGAALAGDPQADRPQRG